MARIQFYWLAMAIEGMAQNVTWIFLKYASTETATVDYFFVLLLHNILAIPLCISYSLSFYGRTFWSKFSWKQIKKIRWQWFDAFLCTGYRAPYIAGLHMIGFGDCMTILVSSGISSFVLFFLACHILYYISKMY